MTDKSLLLLIPILTIVILLSLSISNANATVVNQTDFSMQVPNDWVYRENFAIENNIVLTPNEFADILISNNVSAILNGIHGGVGVIAEFAPDVNFPIKNAPVETYAKLVFRLPNSVLANSIAPTYENATVGGERAIKAYVNSTELLYKLIKALFQARMNSTELAHSINLTEAHSINLTEAHSINLTELARVSGLPDTTDLNLISYLVIHHDQAYYLNYLANAQNYQKYLPQFEQMVKSFKFTK